MDANLAEYHVPVNADEPSLEAILVEEHDLQVNALGIKGWARSASPAWPERSPMPCGTRRAFAAFRSRSSRWLEPERARLNTGNARV
jgi:hypothetical protein